MNKALVDKNLKMLDEKLSNITEEINKLKEVRSFINKDIENFCVEQDTIIEVSDILGIENEPEEIVEMLKESNRVIIEAIDNDIERLRLQKIELKNDMNKYKN